MFEDMFKMFNMFNMLDLIHFHCAEEVRNFFKFHISWFLYVSSAGYVSRFEYLL